MTDTNFRGRLKLEVRTALVQLAKQWVADEIVHPDDVSFDLSLPGEDPHFHELVSKITEQTLDQMFELMEEAITE